MLRAALIVTFLVGPVCGLDLQAEVPWAEIQVIDAVTGRGVPLVELETVNSLRFVTDNAGRVAFYEPGLMNEELFVYVRSHGYEVAKDGFGFAGVRITPRAGDVAQIKITRKNLAERLCRLTGEGRYRDTMLLGHAVPLRESEHPGKVAGQDSIQAAVYRDKIYWFWGDTQQMKYPLGIFRTCGATSEPPEAQGASFRLEAGIPYDYFVNPSSGFVRNMIPIPERPEGVVWISGVCTVPDESGAERLVAHYSRRKGLVDELEQGIAVFDDDRAIFEPAVQLPLEETWRHLTGHPVRVAMSGESWLVFGNPAPNVRVRARLNSVLNPKEYEAFTCAKPSPGGRITEPDLDADGKPKWRWQRDLPPVDSKQEHEWIKQGKLSPASARFCPANVQDSAERILLHSGTVNWNSYRQRWILVAGQFGGKSSLLGEVWYAEATEPTGPFLQAVRVATHDRMTFYNVCHHRFLDGDGGRVIHFEGTYTNEFSGNPHQTARYNYNQVLYRLDLSTEGLRGALLE
jgi:hypothetical protein